jgi:hypothetical protein
VVDLDQGAVAARALITRFHRYHMPAPQPASYACPLGTW